MPSTSRPPCLSVPVPVYPRHNIPVLPMDWEGVGFSDPANCFWELLPPARQARLDISLGAGEGWCCTVGISEDGSPIAGHGVPRQV